MDSKTPQTTDVESDESLAERIRRSVEGDLRAFETLVERHKGRVTANCRSLSGSADDAEDLAQEVFVKAYFGISKYEGRAKFKTWLQRIKINHCLNHLRKKKGKAFVDIDDPVVQQEVKLTVDPKIEERLAREDAKQEIADLLATMPETLRVPLVMCDMDGCSYQEIADALSIGLSATKMRIKRGREDFRRRYEAFLDELDRRESEGSVAGAGMTEGTA